MVNFRRLKLGDLDLIYNDSEIRPLITTSYKGTSFAVVIEQEDDIIGGVSGYAVDNAAFAQKIIVKGIEQRSVYMDGLIRSLIHFLELDGQKLLFAECDNSLYSSIGFQQLQGSEKFLKKHEERINEAFHEKPVCWIDLKEFFRKHKN